MSTIPERPKKNVNAFIFYCKEKSKSAKESNPTLKSNQIMTELGRLWKLETSEVKDVFTKRAAEDKARFLEEQAKYTEYLKTVTPDEAAAATAAEIPAKKVPKAKKDPSLPKQRKNAYNYFCEKMRKDETVVKAVAGMKQTAIFSEIAKRWKALNVDEKKEFEELSAADKIRYDAEMKAFHERAIAGL